jgi:hypothetical protein
VSSPIETIDGAIAAMDAEVDRCVDCGDAGGYFTIVYRAVTERVRAGIVAGEFADCEQMERFDVLFALRYLDARERWYSGSADVPLSWRVAFETARDRRCLVAQHLLLGINAHINLDLGVAAAAAAPPGEVEALRDDAWDFATSLSTVGADERARLEAGRDAEVAALGARIARPGRPMRWLVGAAQRRERHDLQGVIAGLGTG